MKCDRCKGFMYHGFLAGPIRIYVVQKCVNCGEILDEVIASNRTLPLNARVQREPPLQTEGGLEQELTWGAHKPVKGLLRR